MEIEVNTVDNAVLIAISSGIIRYRLRDLVTGGKNTEDINNLECLWFVTSLLI